MMLGGCRHEQITSELPAHDNAPIKTDRASYTLRIDGPYALFKPTATYVNRTNAPVHVEVCGTWQPFFGLEQFVGEHWESVELAVGYGCASELIHHEVPPGGRFAQPFDAIYFDATDALEGLYRMVWVGVKATPDQTDPPLPKTQRVSNAFRLGTFKRSRQTSLAGGSCWLCQCDTRAVVHVKAALLSRHVSTYVNHFTGAGVIMAHEQSRGAYLVMWIGERRWEGLPGEFDAGQSGWVYPQNNPVGAFRFLPAFDSKYVWTYQVMCVAEDFLRFTTLEHV